jgi:hypothetical protein
MAEEYGVDFQSKVVGVTRHNHDGSDRQVIAAECRQGEELVLRREPDNPQDKNAVAVFRENGDQVGYLSASVAEQLAPLLDADAPITAEVSEVTGGTSDHPYGVNIRIHDNEVARAPAGAPATVASTSAERGAGAAVDKRSRAAAGAGPALPARRGCALAVVTIIGGLITWAVLLAVVLGAGG